VLKNKQTPSLKTLCFRCYCNLC